MKGLRLEKMDDILHDFKNPAIAVAGFAKRAKKLLEDGDYLSKKEKIDQALDIILRETSVFRSWHDASSRWEGREGRDRRSHQEVEETVSDQ